MAPPLHTMLGRRERQIMDAVYRVGRATVTDVIGQLPDPPTYSSVRAMLAYLERKGLLRHERDGVRYVYLPIVSHAKAQRSALQHLVRTFFRGSKAQAVAALLEIEDKDLTDGDLDRLSELVRRARREGR